MLESGRINKTEENSVVKTFFYGLLVGIILTGTGWFVFGRNDISRIRQDYDRAYGDFQNVQRNSDSLTADSSGFAGDITVITETSKRIDDRAAKVEDGFTELNSGLGQSIDKVDELEQYNIKLIRVGRDIGDLAFDLRRIDKKSRETE